jgi:hypothetical protein
MTWYNGVPAALLFSNTAAYAAAAAAATTAQSLMAASSGNAEQPAIPFGFLEQGRPGQVVTGGAVGTVTGQATATTMVMAMGLNSTIGGNPTTTAILTTAAYTVTSFSNVAWELDFQINFRTTGFGTASVSTTPYATANFTLNPSAGAPTSSISDVVLGSAPSTIDASVTQWLWLTVAFNTASATNSCTLQQMIVYGMS